MIKFIPVTISIPSLEEEPHGTSIDSSFCLYLVVSEAVKEARLKVPLE